MRKLLQNERGLSLIVAILFMVITGILVAALMSSSVHNIIFGQNELDQKRAFYAAEAGVEHFQSQLEQMDNRDINDVYADILSVGDDPIEIFPNTHSELDYIDIDKKDVNLDYEGLNAEYEVKYYGGDEDGYFQSIGTINSGNREFQQRISFDFLATGPAGDVITLLYTQGADYLYRAKEGHEPKSNREPGHSGPQWINYWDRVAGVDQDETIYDYVTENEMEMNEIEIWDVDREEDYELDDYVVNIVERSGADDEYSFEPFDLLEAFVENELDGEYDWNDGDEIEYDHFYDAFVDMFEDEMGIEFERREGGEVERNIGEDDPEHIIYEPYLKIGDDGFIDDWGDVDTDEIDKWDIIEYDEDYYEAQVNSPSEEPDEDSDEWEKVDEEDIENYEESWNNVTIKDSVVIVNGDLNTSNVTLENSLVIVKDHIDFDGNQIFDNSLMIGFNDDTEDYSHAISGNPSIDVEGFLEEDTYENWPIIRDVLKKMAEYKDRIYINELEYWRAN